MSSKDNSWWAEVFLEPTDPTIMIPDLPTLTLKFQLWLLLEPKMVFTEFQELLKATGMEFKTLRLIKRINSQLSCSKEDPTVASWMRICFQAVFMTLIFFQKSPKMLHTNLFLNKWPTLSNILMENLRSLTLKLNQLLLSSNHSLTLSLWKVHTISRSHATISLLSTQTGQQDAREVTNGPLKLLI